MITKYPYCELPEEIRSVLSEEIKHTFGDVPIVRDTEWATPDWTVIKFDGTKVASFYNIILRDVLFDNVSHLVAGINNVITPKKYRGKGYASTMLSQVSSLIFEALNCEAGLLLCADELIPFYKKLGWYSVKCPVYCQQPQGKIKWDANTMLMSNSKTLHPASIDLNGLPW